MSDVEKRAILVANNWNMFMFTSLQTFLNFPIITKITKKKQNNSQDHLIKHLKIFQKEE